LADQETTLELSADPPVAAPAARPAPATGRARTVVVEADPRSRGSFAASLSLVAGVVAVLAVLTGVLAGPGIVLGAVAGLLGVAGLSASSSRHVAGHTEATLAIVLGLGASVLGGLAMAGTLDWLSTETDGAMQLRDWLQARVPWLFPS
jgi:hypothetical protein